MQKKVIVIEDDDSVRIPLVNLLKEANFEVYEAADKVQGLETAERWWGNLDVAVLDMQLIDTNDGRNKCDLEDTGAWIAIKLLHTRQEFPPEFLIYSHVKEVDYYDLAFRLGAARYLFKGPNNKLEDVVRHVKVLALKRALSGENPENIAEISRLAVRSDTKPNAIREFCRRRLREQFKICLRANFIVLFGTGDETELCAQDLGNGHELPTNDPIYTDLQVLAHGEGNVSSPFVLKSSRLADKTNLDIKELRALLDGAAFLPLKLSNDLRLSIGILRDPSADKSKANEAEALCTVLSQHLRPTVLENILNIWSQWTELRATLNSTARLCLSVGQELDSHLAQKGELESLAIDLKETGQYLTQLGFSRSEMPTQEIHVEEVINSEWQWIEPADVRMDFNVRGECTVEMQPSDLQIIVSRLLQWLAYRGKFTPVDIEPGIEVFCECNNGVTSIRFEDRSERLDRKLREELFAPFTQIVSTPFPAHAKVPGGRYLPLYLAKMLVEGRYQGSVLDHSNGLTDRTYGHRILVQLPTSIRE